jgi:hypothetical protein
MDKSKFIEVSEGMDRNKKIKLLKYMDSIKIKIITNADGSRINIDKISKTKFKKLCKFLETLKESIPPKFAL